MAKKEIEKELKDLGTVKEVFCSGVAITTTGEKIFLANIAKGDRIIKEDGKVKVAPKVEKTDAKNTSSKNKDTKQSSINPPVILEGDEGKDNNPDTSSTNSNDNKSAGE